MYDGGIPGIDQEGGRGIADSLISDVLQSPHKRVETLLVLRMREIAYTSIRFGFELLALILRREGFTDNYKRLRRIYREQDLNLRTKRSARNRSEQHRVEKLEAVRANQIWSMIFVAYQLFDGRKPRILTIVDNFSKKCPVLFASLSIKGADVINFLETMVARGSLIPKLLQVDNGSEFI